MRLFRFFFGVLVCGAKYKKPDLATYKSGISKSALWLLLLRVYFPLVKGPRSEFKKHTLPPLSMTKQSLYVIYGGD